ncbi:DUF2268 domain-containing protein [Sphingomonas sp. Leaf21]|uniref:DUF2268 domain-containing protein n=1 Tax=Sphingomonas sp. Leaf21 TaxID=2876550 RepID=UPI001E2A48F8|nr:DUF2268 domain-containing protein [Sphingomonas sp. Leaf21]
MGFKTGRVCLGAIASLAFAAPAVPQSHQASAPRAAVHAPPVVDTDIARFWTAFDAIQAAAPADRLKLIQTLYIDAGTPGLHALMAARRYTPQEYVDAIAKWPKFWASVRPLTARSRAATTTLNGDVERFRRLYPRLRPATITYAIGVLRTGGTTVGDKVLIGAELGLGDESVDVSELPEPLRTRLATFFRSRPFANNAQNNIHEYVHTQQQETDGTLLQQSLREGVAELVAELITGRKPALPVYSYGPTHEAAIKARFVTEMGNDHYDNWLWNSAANPFGVSDLGYFVGYRIAQRYYDAARDKKAAIRTLIELPYNDPTAIRAFTDRTGYFLGA